MKHQQSGMSNAIQNNSFTWVIHIYDAICHLLKKKKKDVRDCFGFFSFAETFKNIHLKIMDRTIVIVTVCRRHDILQVE